jgi:hypothetical protein
MKTILGIVFLLCAFAANAQPRYPGDDRPIVNDRPPQYDMQKQYGERPMYDRSQKACRHLIREREYCEDNKCRRYMDRRVRMCMSR